ncbi:MAG: carboxypeptidase regulatory-like domain-containing protein [Terriglobales bacterium]
MKATLCLLCFAVLFLLIRQSAFAQGAATGDLHVTVKDPKGSAVTNATIAVSNVAKGLERTATSDGQGGYSVRQLSPGTYTVTVNAPGFAKVEATEVVITVGGMVELPVALSVAGGKEVVEVSAQADLVETSRTSSTDTIGERRIDNLPINGRNYINFTLTDSQVSRDNAPNTGAAPTSGLNMSGQRARSNLVNVDGADATDNSTNGVRSTVSQEDVQEFQIITNSYAAEYGRAAGGVVNIITRSGSNDFHGDVFGYLRDRDFQAVNPFSTTSNPAYTRVQAGTAFGGPIKKDKTYYFFSYEVTRRHETGFSSIGQDGFGLVNNVDISPAFGLPSGSIPLVSGTPEQQTYFANLPAALQQIAITLGPAAADAYAQEAAGYGTWVGGSSGIAVNGTYPVPAFTALASFGAIPTPPTGTFTQFPSSCTFVSPNTLCNGLPSSFLSLQSQEGNFPVFEGTSLYSLRLDHNLTNSNRMTLRANVSPSTVTGIEVNGQDQPFGQNSYSRTSQQTYRDVAGVFQDTWTIGNNKVNEFLFQFGRRGLAYFYNKSIAAGDDPGINIIGEAYIGREPYSFIQRVEKRYQFIDNFSWTLGSHNTKFGVDFNYLPLTATFTVNYGGVYDFSDIPGLFPDECSPVCPTFPDFSSVQAYGLGIPSYIVQGVGSPNDSFSNKPLGVFWQDSWRARPNLTLNLGLRYDVEFPPTFAPPDALAQVGYNYLGVQKGIQTDTHNVQPRIGLAFDPKGDGKTVIRSSYGIFFDHPLLGLYFLGDASDGSKTGQLLFFGSNPCDGSSAGASPLNLNATNMFQGILGVPNCLPAGLASALGYQNNSAAGSACLAGPNPQRFDPCFPNSPFLNQQYITGPVAFPLISQPFGYPQGKGFVYAYSQQVNFSIERDLGNGFALNLAYNFNGGRHLNRPINANPARGDLLTANWQAAVAAGAATTSTNPLDIASCGVNPIPGAQLPFFVPSPLVSFFRPSGLNPSLAGGAFTPCVPLALADLQATGLNTKCNPLATALANCVVFSDMDANYSNGSSVYHGFSANLRKRFNNHYEFLASYTWSHAIDDSTDLQATLVPQDSFYPGLDRSSSTFDQRHRFVFSGVYQTGKLTGSGFAPKFFSDWTFSPLIEFGSGRPFNIITGSADNLQFSSETGRPNIVPAGTPTNACGYPTIASKYSPSGYLQEVCFADITPTQLLQPNALLLLDGNLGRNAGVSPWNVFNDLRISKRVFFGERYNMDLIADMFNIANVYNYAAVSPLFTNAGQATAAYDPRQFQFALKLNW